MYKYRRFKISKSIMAVLLITLGILAITGTSLAGKMEYNVTLYLEDDIGPVEATGTASWPGLGVELRFSNNLKVTVGSIDMDLHGLYLTRKRGKIIAVSLFLNDAAGDLYRTGKVYFGEVGMPEKGKEFVLNIDTTAEVFKKNQGKKGQSGEEPMGEIYMGSATYTPQAP